MTDEPSEWRLLLSRRDFLQLGLASPLLIQDLATQDPDTPKTATQPDLSPASDARSHSINKEATGALRPPPTERRDYFPLESELVSVRGLAPCIEEENGGSIWLDGQTLSLRNLARERSCCGGGGPPSAFHGAFPRSIRELITPQQGGREWRRMGSGANQGSTSDTRWSNWLTDYVVEVARENVSSAEKSPGNTIQSEMETQRRLLLAKIVNAAHDELHFRAVGSGHSHSEAAKPKSFFTNMKEVAGKLEENWLHDESSSVWARNSEDEEHAVVKDNLIRLGAGTVLKKLNRDILPDEDLALPNMGAWDGQTLAGAINTSTHGTGLGLGTFADLVRSVEIITVVESQYDESTPYVRILRIEPSDGITDPVKFAADTHTHDMALIQNDDLFHSVVVGYGCMGIVYAYTLELQKSHWLGHEQHTDKQRSYWLREENEINEWGAFDPLQGAKNNRHYSIYVDLIGPQIKAGNQTPICLVRKRNRAEAGNWEPTERSNPLNLDEKLTAAIFPDIDEDLESVDFDIDYEEVVEQMRQMQDLAAGFHSLDVTQMFAYKRPFRGGHDKTA